MATRSYPAFAVSQFDLPGKTETYEIFRHPEGGRKDIFRWSAQGEKPVAELEIYRPGGESVQSGPAIAEIAARMDPEGMRALEAAGVIDSKFGTVTLLRLAGYSRGRGQPASASSNVSTSPICESPAGRARATPGRPGAPRWLHSEPPDPPDRRK